MDLKQIPAGKDIPNDLNVVIEIPQGSSIKYELDKASGAVMVDRFLFTAMHYPMNYGFIPNTLAEDGDPTDCLVWSPQPVQAGAVLRVRPVGVLLMEDESGIDAKIIAVPHGKLAAGYEQIKDVADLPESLRNQIRHFFEHYKDLEPGKWVKVTGWEGAEQACAIVKADVQRHG